LRIDASDDTNGTDIHGRARMSTDAVELRAVARQPAGACGRRCGERVERLKGRVVDREEKNPAASTGGLMPGRHDVLLNVPVGLVRLIRLRDGTED
jgi:hypothetical protein